MHFIHKYQLDQIYNADGRIFDPSKGDLFVNDCLDDVVVDSDDIHCIDNRYALIKTKSQTSIDYVNNQFNKTVTELPLTITDVVNNTSSESIRSITSFSYEIQRIVSFYTRFGDVFVNKALRTNSYIDNTYDTDKHCAILYHVLNSIIPLCKFNKPTILYRGTGLTIDQLISQTINGVYTEKAFMSTTLNVNTDYDGVVLVIRCPSDCCGLYVDPVSAFAGEQEVILSYNTKVAINSFFKDRHNFTYALCDWVC